MSAKALASLSDENKDLQKQIGCMNGIFQLFDRHYFPTGRRMSSHNKRLPPASGALHDTDSTKATEKATDKNLKEFVKDKPRAPTESPRTSFSSSSCSSTLSMLDHSKVVHSGNSFGLNNCTESPTKIPTKQKNSSLKFSQQSHDLRDVIKDSMHREHRGLSVKTVIKEEGRSHTVKHIDSPRPLQQSKFGQPKVTVSDGSMCILAKLQEGPRNAKEQKDGSTKLALKDLPRYSYDGRETRDAWKSATKLKELPRLSLDSKESSLRSSLSESRLTHLFRDMQRDNGSTTNQEPGSNKRPSNVVVKLMGLEAFPDSSSENEGEISDLHSSLVEDFVTRPRNKASDKNKQNLALPSHIVQKDPASPRLRNDNLLMKPTSNSRIPLEQAPWRQPEASQGPPRITTQKNWSDCTNVKHTSSSVYGEIEKRISELEFRKSGKDLRALKQILEAMRKSRKILENQNGEQTDCRAQTSRCNPDNSHCNHASEASNWRSNQRNHSAHVKTASSPKSFDSPISIAKHSKPMDNSRIFRPRVIPTAHTSNLQKLRTRNSVHNGEDSVDKLVVKDPTPRNSTFKDPSQSQFSSDKKNSGKTLRTLETSRAPQLVKAEICTAFGRSTGAVSPRFQEKKHGIDKQSPPTTPTVKSGKARRKSSKQPIKSDNSTGKFRSQYTNLQGSNRKPSSNTDSRNFSHRGDTASIQSESNSSLASQVESEVTSTESPIEINGKQKTEPKERNLVARLHEDMPLAEIATTEQPSPVSVLDATFYIEDPPSPVKKISTAFRDFQTPAPDEAEWHLDNLDHLSNRAGSNLSNEFSQRKLENVKHLIDKLRLLIDTPAAAGTDQIASICKSPSPDHKYIAKILLASGLLKDMGLFSTATPLHSSGHLINPDLFHVLEQTELGNQEHRGKIAPLKCNQKIHRKILFDTVDEILVCKLASEGLFVPGNRTKTGQELLREICSEIDRLQAKPDCCFDDPDGLMSILNVNMMQQPDDWMGCRGEIPAVVLDIERLIFKDLITDVLTAEGVSQRNWPRRQCRKLFTD